jgi:hypothetical protein
MLGGTAMTVKNVGRAAKADKVLSYGQGSARIGKMAACVDTILTIGHSTHTYERFVELLRNAGVTAVADVRTSPHSRHFPHFNRGTIEAKLHADGIAYSFLGEELGGRPKSRKYYSDGVADYERMAAAAEFKSGLKRVIDGAQKYRIALMCAEQDPLDCHRCLLIARALAERGMKAGHILPDGQIVSHSEIEDRLLSMSGRGKDDLFASREEQLASAYRERARKVAYAEAAPDATDISGPERKGQSPPYCSTE